MAWTDAARRHEPGFPIWIRPTCPNAAGILADTRIPVFTRRVPRDPTIRLQLAWIIQCAPMARFTSGGRIHPESCRLGPVADERHGRATGRVGAS